MTASWVYRWSARLVSAVAIGLLGVTLSLGRGPALLQPGGGYNSWSSSTKVGTDPSDQIGDPSMGGDEEPPAGPGSDDPPPDYPPPPWPGDDDSDEYDPGSGVPGGSGGGQSGSGPGGGDPPPVPPAIGGFLWGGDAEIFLNGIGIPDSSWKSELIRPWDTAGPLAPSPDRSVVPSTGVGIEEATDLVVKLPGRDFELTRNFVGRSELMRLSSLGKLTVGGWSLSTDAYVYSDLVRPTLPMRESAADKWQRMGIAILIQSPIRTTIGFQNFSVYKSETVWDNEQGQHLQPPPLAEPEDGRFPDKFREFQPMGPGMCRLVADKLTYRHPFVNGYVPGQTVKLPVWKLIEPGKGTSYFFRKCESPTSCVNLSTDTSSSFDYDTGYSQPLLDKVPAGKLWCQFDEFGNAWSYEYVEKPVTSGTTPRLKAVYLHGKDASDCKARVGFVWGLSETTTGSLAGSGIWHLTRVAVDRPYVDAGAKWVTTDQVDYVYVADVEKRQNQATGTDNWLSGVVDDLAMVVQKTAVHLPMANETRGVLPGEDEWAFNERVWLFRYAGTGSSSGVPSSQLKGIHSPSQIDLMAREDWSSGSSTLAASGWATTQTSASSLSKQVAVAWGLLSLDDVTLLSPAGGGTGTELKLWQTADRWNIYYGHERTYPPDTGSSGTGGDITEHVGRLKATFSRPGRGGPTLRKQYEYSLNSEDVQDHKLVQRSTRTGGGGVFTPFNHRYRLRSSVQRTTEYTRRSDASPSSNLWSLENWSARRRITSRSEERELLTVQILQSVAPPGGGASANQTQSLVSVVPFTVAELVEDLGGVPGPSGDGPGSEVPAVRKWLTCHQFDEHNRPSFTMDPGAFADEYPDVDDGCGAFSIKCRLKAWEAFVDPDESHLNAGSLGSIQTTTYQDSIEPSSELTGVLSEIVAVGGSGNFSHNYPATKRITAQYVGLYQLDPEVATPYAIVRREAHPGTLKFFGDFWYQEWNPPNPPEPWTQILRPDLVTALKAARVSDASAPADYETTAYKYIPRSTDTLQTALLGYPGVYSVEVRRDLETVAQNGENTSDKATTTYYFDRQGRITGSVSPDNVAAGYDYEISGTGTDLTGDAVRIREDVELIPSAGTYSTSYTEKGSTLGIVRRFDVSGRLLSDTDADGVQRSRAYLVLDDPEGAAGSATVQALQFPAQFSSAKFSGPVECEWVTTFGASLRSNSYKSQALDIDPQSGTPRSWTWGQELARAGASYLLSGDLKANRRWAFASVNGEFPASVPDQSGGRSVPYESTQVLDGDGSVVETIDELGNVEKREYDARSRLIRVLRSVQADPTEWLSEERFYDGEEDTRLASGDGLLTRVTQHTEPTALATQARQTKNWYDRRNRLVMTAPVTEWEAPEVPAGPYSITLCDNLDRVTLTAQLNQAGIPPSTWDDAEQAVIDSADTFAVKKVFYSQRGLVYREQSFISRPEKWQRIDHWFDRAGRELTVRPEGGVTTKRTYDSHGRVEREGQFATGLPPGWGDATDLQKGFMLSVKRNTYYEDRAALWLTTASQRTHSTAEPSTLEDNTFDASETSDCVTTYTAIARDKAARPIATINYGTNDSTTAGFTSTGTPQPPDLLVFGEDDALEDPIAGLTGAELVTRSVYNAQGLVGTVSRLQGPTASDREDSVTYFDSLQRPIAVIENFKSPPGPAPSAIAWVSAGGGRWSISWGGGTYPSDDSRATSMVYDAAGNVVCQIAHVRQASGPESVQVTRSRYTWDASLDGGASPTPTATPRHGLLYEVMYPSTSGTPGETGSAASDRVRFGYNAIGEQAFVQDQNGTVRSFIRDRAGRMNADRVISFGATAQALADQHANAAVDTTVSQIITKYDAFGRVDAVISCLNPGSPYNPSQNLDPGTYVGTLLAHPSVQNFVAYEYDHLLGQVTKLRQLAEGPVPVGTDTRYREYRQQFDIHENVLSPGLYSARPSTTTHPDATPTDPLDDTLVSTDYSGAVNDAISRPTGLKLVGDSLNFVRYSYLGVKTFAVTDFKMIGAQLDRTIHGDGERDYSPSGAPVAHHNYGGWDRFGRLTRNSWVTSEFGGGTAVKPLWEQRYDYDLLSRKTKRDDARGVYNYLDEDWRFSYDGLDRVVKSERGRTDTGGVLQPPTTGFPVKEWTLDALGNWTNVKSTRPGPPTITNNDPRSFTAVNELKSSGATNTLYRHYDGTGNLALTSTASDGLSDLRQTLKYDAWNRLVSIHKLKTLPNTWDVIDYTYNGLNWCVSEKRQLAGESPAWRWRFYSPQWQLLVEAKGTGGSPVTPANGPFEEQFWGLRGLDDAVVRRSSEDGDHLFGEDGEYWYYQLTDSLFSVIAHVDAATSRVRQWMSYDAFGVAKVLRTGDWNGDGSVTTADKTNAQGTGFDEFFALGDSRADVNGDGQLIQTGAGSDVDEFYSMFSQSQATPADEVRIGYAGYVTDPVTKYLLARSRWYESSSGRWLTRDPAGYVDGMSLYLYAKGNPLNLVDPTGLFTVSEWLQIGWAGVKGGAQGAANVGRGAVGAVSELGKIAYDVGGAAAEVGGAYTGTFDYEHKYASSTMRSVGNGGSWGEVAVDSAKTGGRMFIAAGTAGASEVVAATYYGASTGDYEGASQRLGGVVGSNLLGVATIKGTNALKGGAAATEGTSQIRITGPRIDSPAGTVQQTITGSGIDGPVGFSSSRIVGPGLPASEVMPMSTYARAGFRGGVRQATWQQAINASLDGQVRSPGGDIIPPGASFDMGHRPPWSFRDSQTWAQQRGLSRKEFLDEQNDPRAYRPETARDNRSRRHQ
ncbi:MAG: hypothetical protein IT436_16140 [Phycisphaerales bacterium]|nr:hypothetical protein [Phycisphaerales bacterium]